MPKVPNIFGLPYAYMSKEQKHRRRAEFSRMSQKVGFTETPDTSGKKKSRRGSKGRGRTRGRTRVKGPMAPGKYAKFAEAAGKVGSKSLWRFLGPGVVGLGTFLEGASLLKQRRDARTAEALLPDVTHRDVREGLYDQMMLAKRESRLARTDPEAYAALQQLASGMPPLASGEFVIGNVGAHGQGALGQQAGGGLDIQTLLALAES